MSELKPKEVGIGRIGDVQGERIAGRRGDKPGELKSQIGSVVYSYKEQVLVVSCGKQNVLSEGTTRKALGDAEYLFGYRNLLPKGYFLANRKPTASTKLSLQ